MAIVFDEIEHVGGGGGRGSAESRAGAGGAASYRLLLRVDS